MSTPLSETAAREIDRLTGGFRPAVGLILGSGLGGLADRFEGGHQIPFGDIPGFPAVGVEGHAGVIRTGLLNGVPCVALRGRAHLYEGHAAHHASLPVRAMARLGIKALFVSNAAGAVNRTFKPGDLMLIVDHLNLMGRDPLRGEGLDEELATPDLSQPYDPELCAQVRKAAIEQRIELREGVYAANLGPSFETPSEVRMAARLGADAVGMSTVPEVITARAMGVRCFGVSCMTHFGAGISPVPLSHIEVIETTDRIAATFQLLVLTSLARVAEQLSREPND
ncbi:MAG: purine-nucleoside phosphorylase [Gemmatimonadales bacterium]|nr:MAG: purine-nucleoside phosphorylase [Gemmatimonadales bacterium]